VYGIETHLPHPTPASKTAKAPALRRSRSPFWTWFCWCGNLCAPLKRIYFCLRPPSSSGTI